MSKGDKLSWLFKSKKPANPYNYQEYKWFVTKTLELSIRKFHKDHPSTKKIVPKEIEPETEPETEPVIENIEFNKSYPKLRKGKNPYEEVNRFKEVPKTEKV